MHLLLKKLCAGESLAREEVKTLTKLSFLLEGRKEINSALSVAIEDGSETALKTLLMLGANANLQCGSQKTSLQFAAEKGRADCVKELVLMAGPSQQNMGWALVIATKNGHAEFVKNLILHGNPPMKSIEAALITAAQNGHADCIESLIVNPALSAEIISQALVIAVENNDVNFVREIMFVGRPSFNSIGEALVTATAKNHIECVELLLTAGAGVASSSIGSDQKEVSPKTIIDSPKVISESGSSSSGEESMDASGSKRKASDISGNKDAKDKAVKSRYEDKKVGSIEDLDRELEAMQEELGLGADFEEGLKYCIMGHHDQAPADQPE